MRDRITFTREGDEYKLYLDNVFLFVVLGHESYEAVREGLEDLYNKYSI